MREPFIWILKVHSSFHSLSKFQTLKNGVKFIKFHFEILSYIQHCIMHICTIFLLNWALRMRWKYLCLLFLHKKANKKKKRSKNIGWRRKTAHKCITLFIHQINISFIQWKFSSLLRLVLFYAWKCMKNRINSIRINFIVQQSQKTSWNLNHVS